MRYFTPVSFSEPAQSRDEATAQTLDPAGPIALTPIALGSDAGSIAGMMPSDSAQRFQRPDHGPSEPR
ncbi:hypothetical protein AB0E01_00335 [Nocardia vinacea]|uniref:hypothetical protein n=1 Tax=Nocardia vinacea TaxID=96468 RepID=UPI003401294B